MTAKKENKKGEKSVFEDDLDEKSLDEIVTQLIEDEKKSKKEEKEEEPKVHWKPVSNIGKKKNFFTKCLDFLKL